MASPDSILIWLFFIYIFIHTFIPRAQTNYYSDLRTEHARSEHEFCARDSRHGQYSYLTPILIKVHNESAIV